MNTDIKDVSFISYELDLRSEISRQTYFDLPTIMRGDNGDKCFYRKCNSNL